MLQLIAKLAFHASIEGETLGTIEDMDDNSDSDSDSESEDEVSAGKKKKKQKQPPTIMKKMRKLIGYFNRSSQAQEALDKIQMEICRRGKPPVKLLQDVVTRWWSTYTSILRLVELRETLEFFFVKHKEDLKNWTGKDKKGKAQLPVQFVDSEWSALSQLTVLLKPFKVAQTTLSGKNYVTASLAIPMILNIKKNWISWRKKVMATQLLLI